MSEVIPCPDAHQTMWRSLGDKDYRDAFAEAYVGDFLASQIYTLRLASGWSQAELAKRAETTQPMISDWEKSCEGVRLSSLHKVASAFDVAVMVKFIPFSQLARDAIAARADVAIPSFDRESPEAMTFGASRRSPPEPRHQKGQNGDSYLRSAPQLATSPSLVSFACRPA